MPSHVSTDHKYRTIRWLSDKKNKLGVSIFSFPLLFQVHMDIRPLHYLFHLKQYENREYEFPFTLITYLILFSPAKKRKKRKKVRPYSRALHRLQQQSLAGPDRKRDSPPRLQLRRRHLRRWNEAASPPCWISSVSWNPSPLGGKP